jgi:hypothetical protein
MLNAADQKGSIDEWRVTLGDSHQHQAGGCGFDSDVSRTGCREVAEAGYIAE